MANNLCIIYVHKDIMFSARQITQVNNVMEIVAKLSWSKEIWCIVTALVVDNIWALAALALHSGM